MKIKTICLSGLLIATAACSNSSSGNKGFDAGNPQSYKEMQDLDLRLNAKFKSRAVVDMSDSNQAKELYNIGCETEGQSGEGFQIDPAARVGDSQLTVQYSNSQNFHSVSTVTMMIEKIEDQAITTSYKTLSAIIQEAGGEVLKKPIENKNVCSVVNETSNGQTYKTAKCDPSGEPVKDLTPFLTEAGIRFQSRLGAELECSIDNVESHETSPIELGSYKMSSGQTIKAYQKVRTIKGDVVCNGKNLGKGSETRVDIDSNDLISQNMWHCGGTMVTYSTTIRLGDKVIESVRNEIQTARLR